MSYPSALLSLLLLAACDPPQPQLHTLTIIPCTQDGEPLTGCLAISKYYQQKNFWMPESIIDCDPDGDNCSLITDNSPAPSYEIRLATGRYRITAHDLENRREYHQELTITSNSPQWLYVDIMPD